MIYVILAHNSPQLLGLLVRKLQDKNNHFVIHIDSNHNITPFIENVNGIKNCHFTPKRFSSYWGSFALVEATLHAFDFIQKTLKKRQRIILLSGSDFPVKNNKYVENYLKKHKDTIFIQHEKIPRKLWIGNTGGINRFPFYDKVKKYLNLYAGSQWFSIPHKVIPIIMSFIKHNPFFVDYFRRVIVPDESFFQTLLLNCEHTYVKANLRNQNLHFIKWDAPYTHPRTLTIQHLDQIKRSKCLFARKFDIIKSKEILDVLNTDYSTHRQSSELKIAVLYLTERVDKYPNRYKKLKHEIEDADVFSIITDKENYEPKDDMILYEHGSDIHPNYHLFNKDNIIPGCTYLALLHFFKNNRDYDFYWLIEDDVWYNGNWKKFFNNFTNNMADFISTYNTKYNEAPNWFWWNSLISSKNISPQYKVRTFYPICRFSNLALKHLDKGLMSGDSGHGEVLVPTLLNLEGLSLYDIADSKDVILIPSSDQAIGNNNNGTFRYRPVVEKTEISGEHLYHPVKIDINEG